MSLRSGPLRRPYERPAISGPGHHPDPRRPCPIPPRRPQSPEDTKGEGKAPRDISAMAVVCRRYRQFPVLMTTPTRPGCHKVKHPLTIINFSFFYSSKSSVSQVSLAITASQPGRVNFNNGTERLSQFIMMSREFTIKSPGETSRSAIDATRLHPPPSCHSFSHDRCSW